MHGFGGPSGLSRWSTCTVRVRGFGGSYELSRWSTSTGGVAAVAKAIMAVDALPR